MKIMRICLRIVNTLWLAAAAAFLLLDLYFSITEGLEPWNVMMAAMVIGMMAAAWALYSVLKLQICWIEIEGAKTQLLNLRGDVTELATGDIVKIVYGLMIYSLHVWQDGSFRVIRCSSGVLVRKNGKRHRGIWMEDFPLAKFEDR